MKVETVKTITAVLPVLALQHRALDMALARLATLDKTFMPSESGPIWEAVVEGNRMIRRLETMLAYGEDIGATL